MSGACLDELVSSAAERSPNSSAVSGVAGELSYGELIERADRLVTRLHAVGASGAFVGACMRPTPELVVALIAILRAGGCYVPLDPAFPAERLHRMVRDTRMRTAVVDEFGAERLAGLDLRLVQSCSALAPPPDADRCRAGVEVPPRPRPTDLAYVCFTSGSTGRPKGVLIEHRQASHAIRARALVYDEPPAISLLTFSPAFDGSIAAIFGTLSRGGQLIMPPPSGLDDTRAIGALIDGHGVTEIICVPSLYAVLLTEPSVSLSSLQRVVVAGEACPPSVLSAHRRRLPGAELCNEYGPSECAIWATVWRDEGQAIDEVVPIGGSIPGTQAYVLNAELQPVAPGCRGEIYIGGSGVGRGYLGHAKLTAERFLPDPFGPAGGRLYRTGDLARVGRTGQLEFVGRSDDQVKVRGFRVELGEVERVLLDHPALGGAAAFVRPGDTATLEAAVVPSNGAPVDQLQADVRRFAAEHLPSAMVPTSLHIVRQLPRTPSGKVDRAALSRGAPRSHEAKGGVAVSDIERRVSLVWSEVLGLDSARIGREDNFFDLGGHSLLLAKVRARLAAVDATVPTMLQLMRYPTVALLSAFLAGADADLSNVDAAERGFRRRRARRVRSGQRELAATERSEDG